MSYFTSEVDVNPNPLPVTGPLTDTELRASPVPVSGTVAVSSVAGSVAVTGPLTDTQLRATPVPVSGTVSIAPLDTGSAAVTSVAVSTSVATLKAANAARIRLIVFNESGVLFVKLGSAASSSDYTYRMTANSLLEIENYSGIVTGTKSAGSSNAQVTEL